MCYNILANTGLWLSCQVSAFQPIKIMQLGDTHHLYILIMLHNFPTAVRTVSWIRIYKSRNYLKSTWNTFLAARDVKAGRRDGIIGSALQILPIVYLLKKVVSTIHDGLWQIYAISHAGNFSECID